MLRVVSKQNELVFCPFQDEVHDMGDFVRNNPEILGDDIIIISRELEHGPDGRRLDFLVLDNSVPQFGIVELKKNFADEKVLLQTLRYANWILNNPDSLKLLITKWKSGPEIDVDDIIMNKIKIFIVAPEIKPDVGEISQYIVESFDFDFIQLQRYRDKNNNDYAFIIPYDKQQKSFSGIRQRSEYDHETFITKNIEPDELDAIENQIEQLDYICNDNKLNLIGRRYKNAMKFQTQNGRNVFLIAIKSKIDHYIRFCLGPNFDLDNTNLSEDIKSKIKQKNSSKWWSLSLNTFPVERYRELILAAYNNVVKIK